MQNKLSKSELEYWLALLHAPNVGPIAAQQLLAIFPKLKDLFSTPIKILQEHKIPQSLVDYLQNPAWEAVEQDLAWVKKPNRSILTWQDTAYPPQLKATHGSPFILFVEGDWNVLKLPQLALVGSRNPTHTGSEIAFDFARYLSTGGFTITSGLALGIDGAAHKGALAGNGLTIAVMGTGLDNIYPLRHQKLATQILNQGGALVSEFSPATTPKPENFPRRNRIISGLSQGILVVEAALQSGSLITARYALEQGREVFAIPGSIHNPMARGCHALIKQGAKLVESVADIVEELGSWQQMVKFSTTMSSKDSALNTLDKSQAKLVECVGYETTAIDLIITRSGLAAEVATAQLTLLELQGYVTSVSGGYVKIRS